MKLKSCDCGSEIIYIDPRVGFVVFCHTCDKQTYGYDTVEEAMLAWNEGVFE